MYWINLGAVMDGTYLLIQEHESKYKSGSIDVGDIS